MRFLLLLLHLSACSDDTDGVRFDAGPDLGLGPDASADLGAADASVGDLGAADAAVAEDLGGDGGLADAGPGDAGSWDAGSWDAASAAGFGTIAGPCMRLDTELSDGDPWLFETRLDFMMDAFDDPAERPLLTAGAQEMLADGTAGGSSELSEAFAFEVLARCEGASLLKTETEIRYERAGSITDILVMMGSERIGVSVTRAFVFPPSEPYTVAIATELLEDKLAGILESSMNVDPRDAWTKQILAVVAYGTMHAESIATAWAGIDPGLRADTIVYVIVTDGDDDPLY